MPTNEPPRPQSLPLDAELSAEELQEIQEHLANHPSNGAATDDAQGDSTGLDAHLGETVHSPALSGVARVRQHDADSEPDSRRRDSNSGQSKHPAAGNELRSSETRLTLIRKLAEGGLGTVWIARDEKLKRRVAVKEIRGDALDSPRAWQRFQREAEITGHLEHPSVVPLYLYGEDVDTGRPFYAMRFVGKRTLTDAISEYHELRRLGSADELDLHRLLVTFQRVCQAIAYVHSRGVIHRDLKPENIAIDTFGQVVVLDWGLATFVDDGELGDKLDHSFATDDSVLDRTMDGEIVGTPLYMAPEQAAGDLNSIDERTDVYGLGAILFAILTGSAPHERSHTSQDGGLRIGDLLNAIATSETPSPLDANPEIASDLADICQKAMATQRFARHASASQLADEIERWLAGQREKTRQYDSLRMEGRELRANLQSMISDLGKNVRFMADLPPIQEIIATRANGDDAQETVWRRRLATIFQGLLRANVDYQAVAYCQADDTGSTELVRVERHSTERSNIRTVPLSRLATYPREAFLDAVMQQKPGEVFSALTRDGSDGATSFVSGVPVFDDATELPFGYVRIECNLREVIRLQVRERVHEAEQVVLADESTAVWICDTDRPAADSDCQLSTNVGSCLQKVIATVGQRGEYLDETNLQVYAARIELVPRTSSLTLVLKKRPLPGS